MYKFTNRVPSVHAFLKTQIEDKLLVPSTNPDCAVYFQNGDRLTIYPNGTIDWEPIRPGTMGGSKLSMRIHQWFGKGYIEQIKEGQEMNEIAWNHHVQQAKRADELHAQLRQLYGDDHMDNGMMYRRARADGVITDEEQSLLRRMRP